MWYRQNMLLYVRRERHDLTSRITSHLSLNHIPEMPIDVVHPERYEAIASYSQIAFRPLMRKLPKLAAKKLAGCDKSQNLGRSSGLSDCRWND